MAKKRGFNKKKHGPKITLEEQLLCESNLEVQVHTILTQHKFPPFTQQYIFHPQRQWRFDFAFLAHKVAIEVQGYGPLHTSLNGMMNDHEKHNEALLHGWLIIYLMNKDITEQVPNTIQTIRRLLELRIPGSTSSVSAPSPSSSKAGGHISSHIEAARRRLDQIINKQERL